MHPDVGPDSKHLDIAPVYCDYCAGSGWLWTLKAGGAEVCPKCKGKPLIGHITLPIPSPLPDTEKK